MSGIAKPSLFNLITTWLIIALLFVLSSLSSATGENFDPTKIFYQGNEFYQQGDFEAALAEYQKLLSANYASGHLYFNIGNCFFKLGQKGQAILYYEKAKLLMPHDPDLKMNLSYLRPVSDEKLKVPWTYRLIEQLSGLASLESLTIISSLLFILLMVFFILLKSRSLLSQDISPAKPTQSLVTTLIVGSCLLLISLSLTIITWGARQTKQAIIIKPRGLVRFEPSTQATVYFSSPEGSKLQITSKKDRWWLVKRPDGKSGWIDKTNLSEI